MDACFHAEAFQVCAPLVGCATSWGVLRGAARRAGSRFDYADLHPYSLVDGDERLSALKKVA